MRAHSFFRYLNILILFALIVTPLTPSQLSYISVQARNEGGLWSGVAAPEGVLPGSGTCTTNLFLAYLSLVSK